VRTAHRFPGRDPSLPTILASRYLRLMAADGLPSNGPGETDATPGRAWLATRGVEGVVRFPIHRFGSDSAPERRAMRGELIPVSALP
jgi:CRISPR-associated protein Csb3